MFTGACLDDIDTAIPKETDRSSLADLLMHYLIDMGVDTVFGVPGGAIEPLYDALAKQQRRGTIKAVVARHECGAAFMAEGYARETKRLGVVCATTGPGATNLVTGVANAYQNEVPMFVVTAQTPLPSFGKGAFQESSCTGIDILGMFQCCTRYNSLVSHPEQFETKLIAALRTAFRPVPGPVHLSVPLDVFRSHALEFRPRFDIASVYQQSRSYDDHAVRQLQKKIVAAGKVVFLLGPECASYSSHIVRFAERINALLVTTPHGKGIINSKHLLYRGVFGFAGHDGAYHALTDANVDLIIAAGTDLDEWASHGWDAHIMTHHHLVHIDANEMHFLQTPQADMHVCGHIGAIFERLDALMGVDPLPQIVERSHEMTGFPRRSPAATGTFVDADEPYADVECIRLSSEEQKKAHDESSPIKPQWLMTHLPDLFPIGTRFLLDIGNSMAWATHFMPSKAQHSDDTSTGEQNPIRTNMRFAPMGWAIGASVGTAIAGRKSPVVCITGDGSFLMNGQEITTALAEQLNVIFVILNDAALGMVKHGQRLGGAEPIAYSLPCVNFCDMARAMGIEAYSIREPDDLRRVNFAACALKNRPILLDVHVEREEVPPMKMRIKALGASRSKEDMR